MINPKSKLDHNFSLNEHLDRLLTVIESAAGRAILVGGCVRDHIMGVADKDIKDIDIEVYGLDLASLEKVLAENFNVVAVGKSFGIFEVNVEINNQRQTFDVALPRCENKMGQGHKGFVIETNPFMSFEEASLRRDFSINAMGIDIRLGELLDPHGGQKDILLKKLRHVSNAFGEDPLRVLRAAQFCARFNFSLDDETKNICKSLRNELLTLSKERIYEEFKKLLLSNKPSIGLDILYQTDALILFPELFSLMGCMQDKEWHPEGDVWIHTLMVVDEASSIVREESLDEDEKLIVITGALCHDLGKPKTTIIKDGRIKSPAHEQAGVEPTIKFLDSIGFPKKWYDDVLNLVKEHLKPHQLYAKRDEVSDGAIRRLALRVNIDHLVLVAKADFLGRTSSDALSRHDPSVIWLKKRVEDLLGKDKNQKPIILGRHLINLGYKPSPSFSDILHKAFEAQLDGEFKSEEEGLLWLNKYLKK